MATQADTSSPELRLALDRNVHEGVRIAAPVLAALLVFFGIADFYLYSAQVAFADFASAGAMIILYAAVRSGRLPQSRSHVAGTIAAGIVVLDVLHDAYVLPDPQQTMYLMLAVVGCGAIFLSTPWVVGFAASTFGGWALVALLRPSGEWTNYGFALFAACILGVLINVVRLRTFRHMESMRTAEVNRKEQLQIRESALESAVEALQESEERYRRLVDGAPDAFLVHSEGRIVYANTAAAKLIGAANPQDLIGRDAFSIIHPEFIDEARRRSELVEKHGRALDPVEMKCVRLDGAIVDVEALGQPIMYLGRPADQTVIRDITDRKRAETERLLATQRLSEISRLKEMDRVKTQFVNTISHELRTPLTPIKVQLHIMKGAKTAEQMHKATDVLDRNVSRLSSLVDELLEVARIQAGTLKLAKTYVDLGATIQQSLDSFVDVARQNGMELVTKVEPGITVLGDPKRITQVMYNLLGNAVKFSSRGGRILVEVRREGAGALVSVRDEGSGMEPDDITRLFEPFSQLHDTMEKTNAGTGLGLYISRGIVEGHGGKIWAESAGKGQGSRFAFTIPITEPKA